MTCATEIEPSALKLALHHCESERVHQIGQIQSHGAMLVLAMDAARTVLQASENIQAFLNVPLNDVLQKSLLDFLGEGQKNALEKLMSGLPKQPLVTGQFTIWRDAKAVELNARIHQSAETYVIELTEETDARQQELLMESFLAVQRGLWNQQLETNLFEYCELAAEMTRNLLGFDRVMVYRFDSSWDGEVIAESCAQGLDSYLGNRFPAGDIPPQVRQLYTINHVRMIADVNAESVSLVPQLNPRTSLPLDMSHAMLRSFSLVHVEYLRNMGVRASLSISLMQNGRLWGLIACHHTAPKIVSNDIQRLAELISTTVSVKLSSIEERERHDYGRKVGVIVGALLKEISSHSLVRIMDRLLLDLLDLIDASGVVVMVEGKRYQQGELADAAEIDALLAWLGGQPEGDFFATDHLSEHFAGAAEYAKFAAGILATPVTPNMKNCVIWFRKEKLREVNWSGKPEKNVVVDTAGAWRISPRTSFASWTEIWRDRCDTWLPVEVESAGILSKALTEALAQKDRLDLEIQEHNRAEADLLRSNADLQRFAEVTAHHLQEPARRLSIYAGQLSKQLHGKVDDPEASLSLEFISAQSRRLQDMLGDIERYLAADQPRGEVHSINVAEQLAVMLHKIEPNLRAAQADVKLGNLPNVLLDLPRFNDIFKLALGNALTYAKQTPLHIFISGERLGNRARYCIRDNGIGIAEQYRERVFSVFERLQSGGDGSGIGLSILRRIAESAGGRAWIEEAQGGGVCVLIDLPAGN